MDEQMSTELVRVKQLPIIEERLRSMKEYIERVAADAEDMVCTPDTIQAVKTARADLRRQFDGLEEQRKMVKAAVLGPYETFEAVYRECVSEPMRRGDAALKQKIDDVESEIKRRCEEGLRSYFDELCAAHHIDWLDFESVGVKVDMASAKQKTPKKLREQLARFVARVNQDMDTISTMDSAEEILVAYKVTLDLARAIGTVQERHRRIEAEREAAAARAEARKAEQEAARKVEALAPPTVKPEPMITASFQLDYDSMINTLLWMKGNGYSAPTMQSTDTRERLIILREWLKANHYDYK